MIARYRIDRMIAELSDIQRHAQWGMTCNGSRVSHIYCQEMTVDSDRLRTKDDVISSHYGSCLEFSLLIEHYALRHGIQGKKCVIPYDVEWAMHGFVVVGDIAISMGNFIYISNIVDRMPFVEVDYVAGESRHSVYEKMRRISVL